VAGESSAFADIEAGWVLRQQCGGLLTVAASSSRTADFRASELTLSTRKGPSSHLKTDDSQRNSFVDRIIQPQCPGSAAFIEPP
jgi:hypothetical protein